jgi:hypothetical protein
MPLRRASFGNASVAPSIQMTGAANWTVSARFGLGRYTAWKAEMIQKTLQHCGLWEEQPARGPSPVQMSIGG